MKLQGKTAVITGTARGIGEEISLAYAKEGASLYLLDIMVERAEETARQCRALGVQAQAMQLDVANEQAVYDICSRILEKAGKVDILVNNAGIYEKETKHLIHADRGNAFANIRTDYIRRVMDINVMGTMYMTAALLPHMQAARSGKIINLGSVAGVNGIPGMAEYSASKGAIIAFTKALAHEVAPFGINVNCISPGSILVEGRTTPMTYLGRYGHPADIAGAAVFLASAEADFIVGQNLVIDGGRTLSLCCDR